MQRPSLLYALGRGVPVVDGALFGIKAAVLVIVVEALIRIGRRFTLKTRLLIGLAGAAFVGIFFLDLDRFKDVNDKYGHDAGDLLLKQAASRLSAHVRKSDTIARIGGDEFNIILPGITHAEDTAEIARNIIDSFHRPFRIADREVTVTTSIGISIFPDDGEDADMLLKRADAAMYGITTFMADYAYKESQGEDAARAMRLAWLRDITAVAPSEDFPVAEFTSRTHGTSQIVGYNKPAMFFFMLRESIGREAFDSGVRRFYREHRFRTSGWDDLRRAFEAEAGRGLEDFFRQWLTRPGAPELRLVAAGAAPSGGGWRASVTVAQREPAFRLALPLRFELEGGAAVSRLQAGDRRQAAGGGRREDLEVPAQGRGRLARARAARRRRDLRRHPRRHEAAARGPAARLGDHRAHRPRRLALEAERRVRADRGRREWGHRRRRDRRGPAAAARPGRLRRRRVRPAAAGRSPRSQEVGRLALG